MQAKHVRGKPAPSTSTGHRVDPAMRLAGLHAPATAAASLAGLDRGASLIKTSRRPASGAMACTISVSSTSSLLASEGGAERARHLPVPPACLWLTTLTRHSSGPGAAASTRPCSAHKHQFGRRHPAEPARPFNAPNGGSDSSARRDALRPPDRDGRRPAMPRWLSAGRGTVMACPDGGLERARERPAGQ